MTTKLVLSLDGGGIRGTYQAILLDHIRDAFQKVPFDLIVGVSAGALNAITLAQQTCRTTEVFTLAHCKEICNKSFLDKVAGRIQPWPVYSVDGKRNIIRKFLTAKQFGELKIPTAIVCYDVEARYPTIYKSWLNMNDSTEDIALATTAAPIYYPAHKYNSRWYIDGGVAINNPSCLAMALGKELFPDSTIKILSIGTGDTPDISIGKDKLDEWGSIQWLTKGLFSIFTNAPSQYSDEVCQIMMGNNYMRIEDDQIGSIEPDDSDDSSYNRIVEAANKTWDAHRERIVRFVQSD